ncbi:DNA-binding proteins Bright/BRCAA1/RBP1 and proteins containing BRIGHT domain [Lambiella insularis]|nr:DNA-binding proteins Bright/BRCAA1/RBP1 and proteins containing BRIGHT domain [Lambiella insularis]
MASTVNKNTSAGMTFVGGSSSVAAARPYNHNFWHGKESFAAVAARTLPTNTQHAGLPTPPNSISPNLPPQAYKKDGSVAPPTPPAHASVDSDIDLQDAVDHAKAQDLPQRGLGLSTDDGNLPSLDTTGNITPSLLARHYLPDILLNHGPLAIRHVMGYLTTSVPGFSGIPPAKARRLVVGALEGRGSGGEGGGLLGDVEFEKVGWGRWDARYKGQPSKHDRSARRPSPTTTRHQHPSLRSPSPYASSGIRIPRSVNHSSRSRLPLSSSRTPLTHESLRSLDSDTNMMDHETEADRMSLDDGSGSSSEAPDEGPAIEDDLGEVTEEEDWASIGAAALRAGSFPSGGGGKIYTASSHASRYRKHGGGGPVRRALATSMPGTIGLRHLSFQQQQARKVLKWQEASSDHVDKKGQFTMEGIGNDSQERDAIQALLSLSSV